jgi:CDP-diacylglycerol---glycerol-3-phosphate 3-phosphatidyltransferase
VTFTIPNVLTFIRMATVPLLIYLVVRPGPMAAALATAVFFFATITDFLDGYVARRYGSATDLGKFLDPLADKLIVAAALIMLAIVPRAPRVPLWMVTVLVAREVLVTGLRTWAAARGRIIGADELGKYKMALQAVALHGLLLHYTYFHVDFFAAGMFVLWIATIVTVWSGIEYFVKILSSVPSRAPVAASDRLAV